MTDKRYPVPGFPRFVITRQGDLFDTKTGKQKTWYRQDPVRMMGGRTRNMKRGYRIARVRDTSGKTRHIFQHRILAILFIPCPGNPLDFVVNHIDGDGSNNMISNLEWVTYSENMYHAYATGLCGRTRKVLVRDTKTDVVEEFISVADCARRFSLPHATLTNRLKFNPGVIFDDGFSFKYSDDETPWSTVTKRSVKSHFVIGYHVNKDRIYTAATQKGLSERTGVPVASINASLKKKSLLPLDGFVFGYGDLPVTRLVFTPWQKELLKIPRKRADQCGWLECSEDMKIKRIRILSDIAEDYGLTLSATERMLKRGVSRCGCFTYEKISPYPTLSPE